MRRTGWAVLAAGLLAATAAQASLAPEYYLRARATAPLHLQLRLTKVEAEDGTCALTGQVVETFRGSAAGEVVFYVHCLTPGVTPMPGANAWFNPDRFQPGAVIEGFFERDQDGDIAPALSQMSVVPAVRDRPWCAVDDFTCELP